jgi:hypothetical protein
MTEIEPGAEAPSPPQRPTRFGENMEKEIDNQKKPLELLEEKLKGTGLVTPEASKIKKEILNYVYSIEQYTQNVKLEENLREEAQNLVKKALFEAELETPQNLVKLHKELEDMTLRLDDLVGRALGISDKEKPSLDAGIEELSLGKDDTKPFKFITD